MLQDIDYILFLYCTIFSFFCAIVKQLYDNEIEQKKLFVFIIETLLSTSAGIITGFILTETLSNKLAVIGFSGFGAIFGTKLLDIFAKLRLGKSIKIKMEYDDE